MTATRTARVALAGVALAISAVLAAPAWPSGASDIGVVGGLLTVQRLPALPLGAVRLGTVPGDQRLSMRVVLAPRDPASLARFVTDVSSPSSPQFRSYLPRGQFAQRFGPTTAAVQAVRADCAATASR